MGIFFDSLSPLEKVFFFSAAVGGVLFILRMILLLVGGHHDGDPGMDMHGDMDGHHGHHHDSDASFKVLSLQGLTAFFMMFGLVGLALSKTSGFAAIWATLGAIAGGALALWIIGKVFRMMIRLQSDGTLNMKNAMFKEGVVYLTIPAKGEGKVQITVQKALREFTAVSAAKEEIKTDTPVRVVDIKNGNVLVVKKVN